MSIPAFAKEDVQDLVAWAERVFFDPCNTEETVILLDGVSAAADALARLGDDLDFLQDAAGKLEQMIALITRDLAARVFIQGEYQRKARKCK